MQDIKDLVCSVGFPIAACIAMFYLYTKTLNVLSESITRFETKLDDLILTLKTK